LNPLRALTDSRTYRAFLFLASAVPLGAVEFALLLAGWIAVPLLALTPASVPALLGCRWSVRQVALVEAWLARELVGSRAALPPARPRPRGYWRAGQSVLADAAFWRQQAYLFYRATGGWALGVAWTTLIAVAGYLIFLPAYYGPTHTQIVTWRIDRLSEAFAIVPLGIVVLLVWAAFTPLLGRASRQLASGLLGIGANGRTDVRRRRRALAVHAGAYALLGLALVVIWALTSRGYFWPEWALLSLGLPLVVHGWVELIASRPRLWRRFGATEALAIHAGVSAAVSIFLVLVWALTTRAYFWPVWALLGLAAALAVHVAAALRGGGTRIERLEETRAGAVDAQDTQLRRIERDLHDGAQARLVALGMSLGMAEQRLGEDPEAARALVAEARAGLGEALRELRDLARGIHPPILGDRGLEAAIGALAARSPLLVDVNADVPERPAPAVETAAYFVAAESLANAAKHSGATTVQVRIERRGDLLAVEVEDNGRGGADPDGNGLRGLRHRVEALDGIFTVASPAGGPTVVLAELPCAW
jgi:signal transduction histidine kinase